MATAPRPSTNGSAKALTVYQGDQLKTYIQEQVKKFGQYNDTNAIIIAPQIEGFMVPANHVPSIAVVQAHWTEQGDKVFSDDIYPQAGGKYSLLKHMIERLAEAAGVKWDPDRCKATRYPNRDVLYEAVGTMQAINGEIYTVHGTKLIERQTDVDDVRLAAAKRYDRYPEKNPKPGTPKFELRIREDLLERDKHRVRQAESKAKLAALRERLNLKATYTLAELRRPFVVPRLTFQPDYDNPEVRKMASANAMGLTRELYGHPASRTPQLPPDGGDDVVDSTGMVHAPRPHLVEPDQETPQDPGPASDPQPEPAAADATPVAPAISTPPVAGAVAAKAAPVTSLSQASAQLIAKVRASAEQSAKRMKGEITVPQLELLQKYLKGNEALVTVFFPEVDAIGELSRSSASAIADWLLNSTKEERHAFADDVRGQAQEGLAL